MYFHTAKWRLGARGDERLDAIKDAREAKPALVVRGVRRIERSRHDDPLQRGEAQRVGGSC